MLVFARGSPTLPIHSYPAYLVPPRNADVRLAIVPRSTIFYQGIKRVATLNDTIASSHIEVPYTFDGGTDYYVNFAMRVR